MSSLYSGDHGETGGGSARASTISIGQAMQRTWEWMAAYQTGSGDLTTSTSDSSLRNPDDDLDLDSLFRRLDRYTAEMREVEDRLKRARSVSERSEGIIAKRFSFEDTSLEMTEPLPALRWPPDSHPPKAWRPRQIPSIATSSEQSIPAPFAHPEHRSSLRTESLPPDAEEIEQDSPAPLIGNWKQWAEQQFLPTKLAPTRASSRYSETRESYSEHSRQRFIWRRQSPSPPGEASHHESSSEMSHLLAQIPEYLTDDHCDYHQFDFSEDDELSPVIPRSWTLPPRTSSMKQPNKEACRESANAHLRPMPRRRMTTSDARPAIRNGGVWSGEAAELFIQGEEPSLPGLSQSTSNATLNSNPPLTPLTLSDPREDQLRREMESFAIQDGPGTLEYRYQKRRPPLLNLLDSDEEDYQQSVSSTAELDNSSLLDMSEERSVRPRRRRRSLFNIFQRRSPVEKLIDMYFEDEPGEKDTSRKGSPVREKVPKSPATPPLSLAILGKQMSF
ncbi:hypothetical protein AYO20_04854 [Fonsecaea nubica]|uniref:Uncharacterized protein n=1 Tax=Fonsecaea nubica TaxID=856822 RepID=A0A178D1G1_9EURO|nr:hypothetical protein AYO20_04854 [Fonsecaea nubica]OAL35948.1 hypothetical protein AYO20_04854 [Fonsecaea nubica]